MTDIMVLNLKIRLIGDEILRQTTSEVNQFDEKLIHLGAEMLDFMHESDGIGLAGPQIGISRQILVTDISSLEKESEPMVFVNPVIYPTNSAALNYLPQKKQYERNNLPPVTYQKVHG